MKSRCIHTKIDDEMLKHIRERIGKITTSSNYIRMLIKLDMKCSMKELAYLAVVGEVSQELIGDILMNRVLKEADKRYKAEYGRDKWLF